MTGTVEYRITLSSKAFASRQYVVAGKLAAGHIGEIDPYDVQGAVRKAKNLAELDYLAIFVAPWVVKVEVRRTFKGAWVELVSAYRLKPGTKVRCWGGNGYAQVEFGGWRSNGDGSQDFLTRSNKRMGCYAAQDVFEVLPEDAAV